jgi:hypothetical protein
MLTALPYRFYFQAICLAGFRVPAGKPVSQSADSFPIVLNALTSKSIGQ